MVDITDFFGGGKKLGGSKRSAPELRPETKPAPSAKVHDVIDLDDDDDDEDASLLELGSDKKRAKRETVLLDSPLPKAAHKVQRKPPTATSIPKQPIKPAKQSPPSLVPAASASSSGVTAQDVLARIPSLDLDAVHVKEGAKFDFSRGGASGADASGADGIPEDFPEGAPNCLLGLNIVFTGVLPNLERDAAESLAKRYGARVTKSISGKTSVVIFGDDAGPKKLEKIKKLKIKAIDENGFKELVARMPASGGDGDAAAKARKKLDDEEAQTRRDVELLVKAEDEKKRQRVKLEGSSELEVRPEVREEDKLWTVRYAPTNLSQICGNKGPVTKLRNWLQNWEASKRNGFKNPGRDGSGIFRTAMLSGPPGIGKTTAAHLLCEELGYDILEKNASDVRSKSLLNAGVKNALGNMSVVGYFKQKDNYEDINGKKFVVIMDEVDGMSGGDRGGVGQLAQYCRKTDTPMILICNERNLPKMRPFDRTCLDIQFRRPDANSIRARLMTIAVREGFQLDPTIIDKLVQSTRGDIRQIINLLSTISKTTKKIGHGNINEITKSWEKNVALKPFDITHKMLDGRIYTELGSSSFTLNDKIALYFDDFDFTPLMIQENYIHCNPGNLPPGVTPLMAVANAADSISQGDLVERKIRSTEQLWSLLPLHAVMSSVRPASMVAGHMSGRINFTSWLGQNSKMGKYYRLLQELQYHTRLSTSADKTALRLSYMSLLKNRLLMPLLKSGSEGVPTVIDFMDSYYLTKEDWDTVMEFMIGPDRTDVVIKKIPTAVKSGFTRKYNSMTHPVAIYKTGMSIGSGAGAASAPDFEDIVDADTAATPAEEDEDKDQEQDLKKDKLIKQKARPTKRKTAAGKAGTSAPKRRKTK